MKTVQIYKDDTMEELQFKCNSRSLLKQLKKNSKSQGNDNIKELYYWNYNNAKIICYSWYDGESGFENKHALPPGGVSSFLEEDSSEKLLFGDIFICKIKDKQIQDFDISDYGEFYNDIFGGFDECEIDDSYEEPNAISFGKIDEEDIIKDKEYESDNESDDSEIIENTEVELEKDVFEY